MVREATLGVIGQIRFGMFLVREGAKSVGLYAGSCGVLICRETWAGVVSRRSFVA